MSARSKKAERGRATLEMAYRMMTDGLSETAKLHIRTLLSRVNSENRVVAENFAGRYLVTTHHTPLYALRQDVMPYQTVVTDGNRGHATESVARWSDRRQARRGHRRITEAIRRGEYATGPRIHTYRTSR